LTEIYIILVLPDRQEDTIRLAHLLKPRFLSSIKDDFKDLNQIVSKIIRTPHGTPMASVANGSPPGIPYHDPGGGRNSSKE
jgi:hypothetical protein